MSVGLELLDKAIDTGQTGVISVRDGGHTHEVHVRFTGESIQNGESGFWGHVTRGDAEVLDWLVRAQATVEVAFNTEQASVFFDSALLRQRRQWFKKRVLLKRPERLTIIERRKDNREPVPADVEVMARIVRLTAEDGTPCELAARVWDVSPTGASFLCRSDQPLPKLEVGEPLSITLLFNSTEHRVNACHRYAQRLSSSSVRLGVQFNSEDKVDPAASARFRQLLEELQSLRIRRSFRNVLRKRFGFSVN